MSDNLPPQQPGQPGPSGQWGAPPPQGPPPGWESGPGQPIPPQPGEGGGRNRAALLGGGLLLTGALVAGGIVGWNLLSGDSDLLEGDQPSQALPAGTLAYAAVDLDPSGKQKIEAIRTLKTFPAFNDEVKIGEDDDVLAKIFELAQQEEDWCAELDYEKDVDSWLGDRFAIAAVADGEETPFPVGVVQVEGEDEARAGLEKIQACAEGSGEEEEFGIAFVDDTWAVVAETQAQVDTVVADVEDGGTLRDDDDFQKWTEETGEAGIVHLYAAPALGQVLIDHFDELFGMGGEAFGSEDGAGGSSGSDVEIPETTRRQLEDFSGAAGTVRFADGALEAEFVGSKEDVFYGVSPSSAGAEAVSSLPSTTVAALGFGLEEGWLDVILDQMGPAFEEEVGMTSDDALAELEKHTGLTRDDIEALGGESLAIAVDGDIDPAALNAPDPSGVPVGLKIKGDTEEIEAALDKLRESGGPEVARYLLSKSAGDYVAVAMNEDYLDKLAGEDGLGDEDVFEELSGTDDPAMLFFVSFDANDNWLDRLVGDMGAPEEFRENLEPLSGVGMSAWVDGDVAHSLLKLTTD